MVKKITILITLFFLVFPLSYAWGEYFLDVWGTSSNDVFVVGSEGVILHYDGSAWHEMDSGTDANLNAIWGFSNSDIYAAGCNSTILHYDGNHWSKEDRGYFISCFRGIWGSSNSDIYAVGSTSYNADNKSHAGIFHYNGNLWSKIFTGEMPNNSSYAVWGFSNSDVFFSGGANDQVYHYDGHTITKMPSSPIGVIGLWGSSHSSLYALTYYDEVYHFNGSLWALLTKSNLANDDGNIWGNSATEVFVVRDPEYGYGEDQDILRFNGSNFERIPCPSNGWFDDVWSSSGSDVYVVGGISGNSGNKGLIVHYNGSTWSVIDYTAPHPAVGTPPPSNQSAWNYASTQNPIKESNPTECKPFAVGDLSSGNLSLQVGLPAFSSGVDIYLAIGFADALFLIDGSNVLHSSTEVTVLPKWKTNISAAIDESLYGDIPTSLLPAGVYNLYTLVVPTGETDFSHFYFWSTSFSIVSTISTVCSPENLSFCTIKSDCQANGGDWYSIGEFGECRPKN